MHRRVMLRHSVGRGVCRQVSESQWLRFDDQETEDAPTLRIVTDRFDHPGRRAVRDELGESLVLADHTQRSVARINEPARRLDDLVEHRRQTDAGGDLSQRLDDALEASPRVDLGHALGNEFLPTDFRRWMGACRYSPRMRDRVRIPLQPGASALRAMGRATGILAVAAALLLVEGQTMEERASLEALLSSLRSSRWNGGPSAHVAERVAHADAPRIFGTRC